MVVLDGFKINPPYDTVVSSTASGHDGGLERVIKVVRKINLSVTLELFNLRHILEGLARVLQNILVEIKFNRYEVLLFQFFLFFIL